MTSRGGPFQKQEPMDHSFTFPQLKPVLKPEQSGEDKSEQNPLLARATVSNASAGQANQATQPVKQKGEQGSSMRPPQKRPGKVMLEKGYSQLDWMRLQKSGKDLAGLKGQKLRRDITMEEVKQHNRLDDAWTVMRGKVYNITPYMRFHPGGVAQLKRGAGIDCTALFNKYHAWVNADMMLESCLVGLLSRSSVTGKDGETQNS